MAGFNYSIVDNQLRTLIELYEEEKVRLQMLITECLAEKEYLHAHYHSNALYQLNGKLQTLHNIDDNLYDEKQFKLERIFLLEKELAETQYECLKEFYSEELLRAKEDLEKLQQRQSRVEDEVPASLLDDILQRFLDNKVKNVKLILKKAENLLLTFGYSNKTLRVTFPYIQQHLKRRIIHHKSLDLFQRLGFEITTNRSKVILTIIGDKKEIIGKLKPILAKIIFEMFYFKNFKNESYIQYTDKSSR